MKKLNKYIGLLAAALMISTGVKAQKMAINNDVLMDAFMMPNIGLEFLCGEKSTFTVNAIGAYNPWWTKGGYAVALQPEYRWYFSGRPMNRWFVGAGGLVGCFSVEGAGKKYSGIGYGAGLTFGYVMKLSNRLNIDFHAGAGLVGYSRKQYFYGDQYNRDYIINGETDTNASGYYFFPTRIGVSLSYIIM